MKFLNRSEVFLQISQNTAPLESLAILICPVSVTFNIVLAKRAPKWLKFNAFRGSWSKSFKFQPLGSSFFQDYVVSR